MQEAVINPSHEYILDKNLNEVCQDILKSSIGASRNALIEEDIEKINSRKLY